MSKLFNVEWVQPAYNGDFLMFSNGPKAIKLCNISKLSFDVELCSYLHKMKDLNLDA